MFCAASHGTGHHLLKVGSKRRRTKAEVKDEQMEEMLRDEHVDDAINKSKRLERDLIKAQREAEENANAAAILTDFMNKGLARVNEKGQFELLNP